LNLKVTHRKDKFEPSEPLKKEGTKPLVYDSSQSYENFYAQVYQTMFQVLFAYGMQICGNNDLVKDTIQELFSGFWKNQKTLKKVQSIKPYLLKCLKRKLISGLRKGKTITVEGSFEFVASHEVKIIQEQTDLDNKLALQNLVH
jgi:RNA polymerase sigma-70 factor (ECF subfamily)